MIIIEERVAQILTGAKLMLEFTHAVHHFVDMSWYTRFGRSLLIVVGIGPVKEFLLKSRDFEGLVPDNPELVSWEIL